MPSVTMQKYCDQIWLYAHINSSITNLHKLYLCLKASAEEQQIK